MNAHLIDAMLTAPLIGLGPNRRVLHAIPMEHVYDAYNTGSATAVCGSRGLKLLALDGSPAPWPPDATSLPQTWHRCRDCHQATTPKRPRVRFARKASA